MCGYKYLTTNGCPGKKGVGMSWIIVFAKFLSWPISTQHDIAEHGLGKACAATHCYTTFPSPRYNRPKNTSRA